MLVWRILSPLRGSFNPAFILFYFILLLLLFGFDSICDCLTAWIATESPYTEEE